ncbi:MAG: TIGR00269 family protein [Nanoarchaeota archaeon]|nr:TIGR00269 family protein [Nanoarchaeota archaeon]
MPCKFCKLKPVITLPNSKINLCKSCFTRYFEKKVLRTIKQFSLIGKKDHVVVAVSGGKDSLSCLYFLNKLANKRMEIKISALLIDEGISGYRNKTMIDAEKFCKENNIPFHIASFKKEIGLTLDEITKKLPNTIPCSVCGVFRRYLLNKYSRKLKATKLATGHNLDDESQSILMNQIRNNTALSARLGPLTGVKRDPRFIPRIKPFYLLTEKETATYAFLKGFDIEFNECPYNTVSFRFEIRDLLNNLELKYPGTKHGIVNSFLEILPLFKERYKNMEINSCKECKEPTSSKICTACFLLKKLK